jgi:hypothetical protein
VDPGDLLLLGALAVAGAAIGAAVVAVAEGPAKG